MATATCDAINAAQTDGDVRMPVETVRAAVRAVAANAGA